MPVISRELGEGFKWRKRSALVNNSKQGIYEFDEDNLMFFQVGFTGRRPGVFTRIYQLSITEVNFIQRRRDMPRGTHGTINSWCVECVFWTECQKNLPEGLQSILVEPTHHDGLFISPGYSSNAFHPIFFFP